MMTDPEERESPNPPYPDHGCPLTFTVDHSDRWAVQFRIKDETWTAPVIGWSVIVGADEGTPRYETQIEPIVLDEGLPTTVDLYRSLRAEAVTWAVVPAKATPSSDT